MKKVLLVLCLIVLPMAASAEWTWVKSIDISSVLDGRAKDVASDSNGSLYFTTYFGAATRHIWKVANPITETTPAVTQFDSDSGYPSSNAAHLAVDANNNIYLAMDTNDAATSWIKKYQSNGSLDTSFGTGGTLSPIVIGGANRRPRAIGLTGSPSNKILVSMFMTPYSLGAVDALTGADGGAIITTYGDSDGNGVADNAEMFQGIAYDDSENAIYGNAMADLIKLTGASANLNDLTTFNTFTLVTSHPRINNSGLSLRLLDSRGWVAYTALIGTANAMQIGIYSIGSALEELAGNASGENGYINNGGSCCIFEFGGSVYVAAVSYYGNTLEVFTGTSSVESWDQY